MTTRIPTYASGDLLNFELKIALKMLLPNFKIEVASFFFFGIFFVVVLTLRNSLLDYDDKNV